LGFALPNHCYLAGVTWVRIAAISGALAIVAGAFGAHWLASRLSPSLLEAYRTAVLYHLLHSVVLLALGLYGQSSGRSVHRASQILFAGVTLFSGSLYVLCLLQIRAAAFVTPLGGLMMIAGWIEIARSLGSKP
jgi:uncharacterized membrane protein YgdD (TMEM256/DUF423 family)